MERQFHMVDVFSSVPFGGNPLAVVVDAEGMSTDEMQTVTRWMNLSETAFLLPPTDPEADYRVRIFTLARELPFAGHPTLGACHTWLATSGSPRRGEAVVQECGAGLVAVRQDGDRLAFAAPPLLRSGPVDTELRRALSDVLGLHADDIVDCRWIDNGPGWVGVLLADAEAVLSVDADFSRSTGAGSLDIGLVGPHPEGSEHAFEIRALFADELGAVREDPVTGSLNASVGQWLFETGRATSPYVARQGTRLGRHGRVHVERAADGHVWVGGATHTRVQGQLDS
jgi:PhzF family phenazine biosynthesis protein